MWSPVLIILAGVAASEDLAARMDTLEHHFQALHQIEVVPDHQEEKARRLRNMEKLLDVGASTPEKINELYHAMDAVRGWLWAHAAERPRRAPGEFEETPEQWIVRTPDLTLTVAREDLGMAVATADTEWRFYSGDETDLTYADQSFSLRTAAVQQAEPFHTGYSAGMRMTFRDFPQASDLVLRITAYAIRNELVFDIAAEETGTRFGMLNWPKAVVLPATEDALSVCPVMQGVLIPGNWHQELNYAGLTSSREFYMSWWGHIVDGDGVMAILETSHDAGGSCEHPAGGPTRLTPRWYASLGEFGYLRTIRYIFQDDTSYVALAKRYRQFAIETGLFKSLREKCVRTSALNTIIGSPIVHLGALYHTVPEATTFNKDRLEVNHRLRTFDELAAGLRRLKGLGIDTAYVHLDGWGFYGYDSAHPDPLPVGYEQGGWDGLRRFADTCQELGYLFAVHDQYRDFYFNAASFDDRLTVTDLAGERFEVSQWCGGPQTILSPRYAPEYVRRNHNFFREHGIEVEGAYLDVFSILPQDESAQPGCPVTRTECARYRKQCFELLRARGYVLSSEEPTDYMVDTLDLVHHAPYALHPYIWAGEEAYGIPIPLFNLVYHDTLLMPWDLAETGGWGIPAGTSGHLHCLLNAGPPYAAPPYWGDEWASYDPARVKEAASLAKHCAFLEMTDHQFLNPERTKQRTTFSDGTQVTVDFKTGDYEIHLGG
jgi:hypothetical protein